MNVNNFDTDSNDVNIELSAFYDSFIAQQDFQECFEKVDVNAPDGFYGDVYFFKCFDADTYVRELLREAEITSSDTIRDILGQIETHLYYEAEINDFYSKYFELDFHVYQTRGYSQGDAATILISKNTQCLDYIKQLINHVFWDQPIYARLEVNDVEYYLDENTDRYDYDKDNMIEQFEKDHAGCEHFDQIVQFLNSELPENLDYV